jgi:hypothetical protein
MTNVAVDQNALFGLALQFVYTDQDRTTKYWRAARHPTHEAGVHGCYCARIHPKETLK